MSISHICVQCTFVQLSIQDPLVFRYLANSSHNRVFTPRNKCYCSVSDSLRLCNIYASMYIVYSTWYKGKKMLLGSTGRLNGDTSDNSGPSDKVHDNVGSAKLPDP